MVKIRLKRIGATKRPVYRLVVADSRSPRDGRFIEAIGFYDPLPNPAVVRIDVERVKLWMQRGARPSDTARDLLVREGVLAAPPRPVREAAPQVAAAGGGAGGSAGAISAERRRGVPAATGPAVGDEPAEVSAAPPASTSDSSVVTADEPAEPASPADDSGVATAEVLAEPPPPADDAAVAAAEGPAEEPQT